MLLKNILKFILKDKVEEGEENENKSEREGEFSCIHWFTLEISAVTSAGPAQKQGAMNSILITHKGGRGPNT